MRVTVSDVVSPSYFPLTAAVELGFFTPYEQIVATQFQRPWTASL